MSNIKPEVIPQRSGSWFNPLKGEGTPSASIGEVGDTYFDTTNNVYYVKGSAGWQNTAGSTQSIPAAASGNRGMSIASTGSAWSTNPVSIYVHTTATWSTSAVCIFKRKNTTNMAYFALMQGYAGNHEVSNNFITVTVHGSGTGFNSGTLCIDISTTEAHGNAGQSTRLKPSDFKFYTSSDGTKLYMRYNQSGSGGLTITNYSPHGGAFYNTADSEVCSATAYSGLTEITSGITYNTTVPCSTAANQMLVSDGNGGWQLNSSCPVRLNHFNTNMPTPTTIAAGATK